MDCIVKTSFGYELKKLYQYDKNQEIKIVLKPDNKYLIMSELVDNIDVHFYTSNSKVATVAYGDIDRNTITTTIPNELLEEGLDIKFYIYKSHESGAANTIASGVIPVVRRIEIGK